MAVTVVKETSELRAAAFVLPLAATVGWIGAHKLEEQTPEAKCHCAFDLVGLVTHVRDGDPIEVARVPVRIANLDCAELGTARGERPKLLIQRWADRTTANCELKGRMSYDRQVGVCRIAGIGDIGEARECR